MPAYEDTGTADGNLTATLTAYLNGQQVGQLTDLGRVFVHGDRTAFGGISLNGNGMSEGSTLFHDSSRNSGTTSDPLSPGEEYFDGEIDDVSMWEVALSQQDVMDHYQAGIVPEPSSWLLMLASCTKMPRDRNRVGRRLCDLLLSSGNRKGIPRNAGQRRATVIPHGSDCV